MMQQPPLHHLLDSDDGGDQGTRGGEALSAVVSLHRRRRAARMRAVSLSVVVALGGTALGLGLSRSSTPTAGSVSAAGAGNTGARTPVTHPSGAGLKFVHGGSPSGLSGAQGQAFGTATSMSVAATGTASAVCTIFGCGTGGIGHVSLIAGRTVGDVHVVAYLVTFAAVNHVGVDQPQSGNLHASAMVPRPLSAFPACERRSELLVRISVHGTYGAEFVVPVTVGLSEPFQALAEALVRTPVGQPFLVAAAEVAPSVARVDGRFGSGASDAVQPSRGWVVLVGKAASGQTTTRNGVALTAFSRAGSVLERAQIPSPGLIGIPVNACA